MKKHFNRCSPFQTTSVPCIDCKAVLFSGKIGATSYFQIAPDHAQ